MSLVIDGSKAKVHWLTNNKTFGKLTSELGILYVVDNKLGQATAESYAGLTPAQAFERRYKGQKSSLKENLVASDLIVFDKSLGTDFDYDDLVRKSIYELHRKNKVQFSANYNRVQVENTNSEAMLGFNREQHIGDLLKIASQSLGIKSYFDTKDPIVWRWEQENEVLSILGTLASKKLCLYAAYTSRGKTKISMEVATRLLQKGGMVLVTTPITDTKKSFEDNIKDFHFGTDRTLKTTYLDATKFSQYTVNELRDRANAGELIFVVLTVQDLRYGDKSVAGIRKKYEDLSGNLDLWIRDERHSQYNGEVTSERLSDIKSEYELDLTATPYNVLDKYSLDNIVSRTLLWGLKNRQHTRLPEISVDAVSALVSSVSPAVAELYSSEEGFDPRKLFARENDSFLLTRELEILADRFYHDSRSRKKNPLSVVNDGGLSDAAKRCGMWVLPSGIAGDSANEYLPALAALLNGRFSGQGTCYIDSYSVERRCPTNLSVGEFIQELTNTHVRVVILTCGKFLTGTDIPCLGHIVLFDKMSSIANFEQLMGRMIREYTGKDRVKLYSLVPGHEIKVVLGQMANANATLGGGTVTEVLDCIPLSEYGLDGKVARVSPADILTEVQEWCREQLSARLPSVSLRSAIESMDTSLWKEVNTREFKRYAPVTELTVDSGARVKEQHRENTKVTARQQRSEVEAIADTIQAMMFEAQWVAYSLADYDYRNVLASDPMVMMFGKPAVDAVIDAIRQSSSLEQMVRGYLVDRQSAFAGLPPEEIYSQIFVSSELKAKAGLVYVTFDLVNEIIDLV